MVCVNVLLTWVVEEAMTLLFVDGYPVETRGLDENPILLADFENADVLAVE